MKLYVYDHCPFCVRARMPFGLKGIPVDLEFMPNDDEDAPIRMIGRKLLPILEDADGFMGESLDIVRKVDGLAGPRLFDGEPRAEIEAWVSLWNPVVDGLVIPRTPDPVFPEFRTEAARAYFNARKEAVFGSFDGLLARTGVLTGQMEQGLADLAPLLPDAKDVMIDDILLFPILRSLSILPELTLPKPVIAYRDQMSERAGIPLISALRAAMS